MNISFNTGLLKLDYYIHFYSSIFYDKKTIGTGA